MSLHKRFLLTVLLVLTAFFAGCKGKEELAEPEAFSFVVYPGSRYLGQVTESFKNAHKILNPGNEPPPIAVYDTDAPVEQVAEFYAKEYGYKEVAPDMTNNLSAAKPPAYYRTGKRKAKTGEPGLYELRLRKLERVSADAAFTATIDYRETDYADLGDMELDPFAANYVKQHSGHTH